MTPLTRSVLFAMRDLLRKVRNQTELQGSYETFDELPFDGGRVAWYKEPCSSTGVLSVLYHDKPYGGSAYIALNDAAKALFPDISDCVVRLKIGTTIDTSDLEALVNADQGVSA